MPVSVLVSVALGEVGSLFPPKLGKPVIELTLGSTTVTLSVIVDDSTRIRIVSKHDTPNQVRQATFGE